MNCVEIWGSFLLKKWPLFFSSVEQSNAFTTHLKLQSWYCISSLWQFVSPFTWCSLNVVTHWLWNVTFQFLNSPKKNNFYLISLVLLPVRHCVRSIVEKWLHKNIAMAFTFLSSNVSLKIMPLRKRKKIAYIGYSIFVPFGVYLH